MHTIYRQRLIIFAFISVSDIDGNTFIQRTATSVEHFAFGNDVLKKLKVSFGHVYTYNSVGNNNRYLQLFNVQMKILHNIKVCLDYQ